MNKKYIIANWKMNPQTWAEAEQILDFVNDHFQRSSEVLAKKENELSLILCPPFVFLEEVGRVLKTSHLGYQAELGAQDIAIDDSAALTGEVSGPMLKKLGVQYVIVGHSERRWKLGESNEVVNKKIKAVLRNSMVPIVCVGEKTRDENYKEFLKEQVEKTFIGLSADEIGKCIIAYEPVWAISSNPGAKPDTSESAIESIKVIRDFLNTKYGILNTIYLYGGSVISRNITDFIGQKEINGVLVGGASVNKEEFVNILSMVQELI